MRVMEQQQQRHMKEIYVDPALKSLASNLANESISIFPFQSAYTQDLQTQRIKEMLTRASKANANTELFDLSSRNNMEPRTELDTASSSHGQVYLSNYTHVEDYMGSVRNLENERRLEALETERRMQEINENDKTKFQQ